MGEMSLYLSCHDASPDMGHDLPESFIRPCHLTGLRSNFQIDLLGSKCIPMFRCVSTRGIRWCLAFSTILSSKVICKYVYPAKKQRRSQGGHPGHAPPPNAQKVGQHVFCHSPNAQKGGQHVFCHPSPKHYVSPF